MLTLIVTEKFSIGQKVAKVLNLDLKTISGYKCFFKENVYIVPLSGHFIKYNYSEQTKNWKECSGQDLLTKYNILEIVDTKVKKIIAFFQSEEIQLIIATDPDDEGEKIGYDFLEKIKVSNTIKKIYRVNLYSLTDGGIKEAFENKHEAPSSNLAKITTIRHKIDLMWGYALSRDISLYSWEKNLINRSALSVGRVQTPLIGLISMREEEIKNWKVEYFYNIIFELANFKFLLKDAKLLNLEKETADKIILKLKSKDYTITVDQNEQIRRAPLPLNTNSLLKLSGKLKKSVSTIAETAEALYLKGYITYPRTDNCLFMKDTPYFKIYNYLRSKDIIEEIVNPKYKHKFGNQVDHECIMPTTKIPNISEFTDNEKLIYLAIVNSFRETLSDHTIYNLHSIKVIVKLDNKEVIFETFYTTLIKQGFYLPINLKNEKLKDDLMNYEIKSLDLLNSETKPPITLSQENLIERMEKLNIGTKSTRGTILKLLYQKKYILGFRPVLSAKGKILTSIIHEIIPECYSGELTTKMKNDLVILENNIDNLQITFDQYENFILSLCKKIGKYGIEP